MSYLRYSFFLFLLCLPLLLLANEQAAEKDVDFDAVVKQITQVGDRLLENYSSDTAMDIGDEFSNIYFDIFEASGMEMAIGMADPQQKIALESQFGQIIGHAMKEAPKTIVVEK